MPVMMSSAVVPVKNIPGIVKAIPGAGENRSPSHRNHCSPSARNSVRLHPGTLFTFTPESRSTSPGIRTQYLPPFSLFLIPVEREGSSKLSIRSTGRSLVLVVLKPRTVKSHVFNVDSNIVFQDVR